MRSRPRWRIIALTVMVGVSALTAVSVGAYGGPVASGEFTGRIGVEGGFSASVPEGSLVFTVQGSGPLQISLSDGTMTGTWAMSGPTTIAGGFSSDEMVAVIVEGTGSFSGSGLIGGPPGGYRMSGSVTSESTVTASVPAIGISQTASETSTDTIDEALTGVIVLCDMIVGRWDLRIRQEIEGIGFDEFLRGYLWASTGIDATEQADRVSDLLADIGSWSAREGEVVRESRALYIGTALSLLDRAQRLQAELASPTPCPPDGRFATQLTLAVQDVLTALLSRFPGITTSHVVALALGSGAIGSGSPVPGAAAELTDLLISDVNAKWNELVADPQVFLGDLLDTARAAQMLGIRELGGTDGAGLSPADVLLIFGEE